MHHFSLHMSQRANREVPIMLTTQEDHGSMQGDRSIQADSRKPIIASAKPYELQSSKVESYKDGNWILCRESVKAPVGSTLSGSTRNKLS